MPSEAIKRRLEKLKAASAQYEVVKKEKEKSSCNEHSTAQRMGKMNQAGKISLLENEIMELRKDVLTLLDIIIYNNPNALEIFEESKVDKPHSVPPKDFEKRYLYFKKLKNHYINLLKYPTPLDNYLEAAEDNEIEDLEDE